MNFFTSKKNLKRFFSLLKMSYYLSTYKYSIAAFAIGLIIGLVLFYLFSRYYYYKDVIEKKSCVKLLDAKKEPTNCVNFEEMSFINSAVTTGSKKPKKNALETPSSYLLQINDKNTDYYEVSVLDDKDNVLWVKNNVSQVDLSTFGSKKVKYKIFNPSSTQKELPHNIYKVPKLTQTFNPVSLNTKKLKFYTDTEIDYQEALVDKVFENSNLIVKKEIKGKELKSYEGTLSRCAVLFVSETDLFDIKTKEISRSFLVYPSNSILTEIEGIIFKEDFHESFGLKITEVVLDENNTQFTHKLNVVFPLLNYKSVLPLVKLIFI